MKKDFPAGVWVPVNRGDGHEHARYMGTRLRMRHTPTGWIISRRDVDGWEFVAGDVRRDVAERKALEWLRQ